MKPQNKFQKRILDASKSLPCITDTEMEWAYENCVEHIGRRTKKGITCLDCGHLFEGDSELGDKLSKCVCPFCSAELKVVNTLQRVFRQFEYMCIVTTKFDFQVLRFFYITAYFKAGQKAQYTIDEVLQRWIATDGKNVVIAKLKSMNFYSDKWNFGSTLEIRRDKNNKYDIIPACIYPLQSFIPELRRNGYKGDFQGISPSDLFVALLAENRAETLFKTGQTDALKYCILRGFQYVDNYWASMKICIRNSYDITDTSVWCDYIDLLRFFGKDIHNAKYVCPTDLKTEHDRYVRKKKEWEGREERERVIKKILEDTARFNELKAKFFGIRFSDKLIQVRVLESVEEIMQEGDAMHHCVFTNEYHLKPDTLILSACISGKRVETVELSLTSLKVLQSRGACNQKTKYHNKIVKLVEKNIHLIQKRLAA